jgi:hypothetical protein
MTNRAKSVQVFGRLKDEHGRVIFTCSASAGVFKIASAECVRLANDFVATKPKTNSGCGCSAQKAKASYKMKMCECCETRLVTSCKGTAVVLI